MSLNLVICVDFIQVNVAKTLDVVSPRFDVLSLRHFNTGLKLTNTESLLTWLCVICRHFFEDKHLIVYGEGIIVYK